jgi:hypothetical protein
LELSELGTFWASAPDLVKRQAKTNICRKLQGNLKGRNPMEMRNTTLDDICCVLGFSATLKLAAWFGGTNHNLYVPGTVDEKHVIAKLVGVPAFRRLVDEWGNEHLSIPLAHEHEIDRRNRRIRDLLLEGKGAKEISGITGVTERRVQQLRREMESMGLLPLILPGNSTETAVA